MVRITSLVDNLVGHLFCWGEHGSSFLIETDRGRVMLDTGASGTVLAHNIRDGLKIPVQPLDAVVLSHGHYDHTAGMDVVLNEFSPRRVIGHSALFEPRFGKADDGVREIGLPLPQSEVTSRSRLTLTAEPLEVIAGVWTTGGITDRPYPDSGSERLLVKRGDEFVQDPYVDDMSLVVEAGVGLVVVLGCCHAGLLNTVRHVKNHFQKPIIAVLGGTHLGGAKDETLDQVAAAMKEECGMPRLMLNHCTTPEVVYRLAQRLGPKNVTYFSVGDRVEF
jgi:7,8-dihydropterin-6-yl-methyl-4-(beta-D-ribofuranosyl)aminobenzene 5'-phosphate synthase